METSWTPLLPEGEGPKYLALARALREAVEIDPRVTGVPSTKGSL